MENKKSQLATKITIPVETIKKVVIWIWNNKSWLVPTGIDVYKTVKGWFKKKPINK